MKNIALITIVITTFTFSLFSQTIKINEFMASNSTTIADEYGEYNDWIELYNYGTDTVNIAGYYITDTIGNNTKHHIPAGYALTKIPPGCYLIIWADNDTLQDGANHLSFKLSADGEQIGLFAPDGTTVIDTITYGQQVTDISYGRYPNGGNTWLYFNFPTPGTSNSMVNIDEADNDADLLIFYPNPPTQDLVNFNKPISFSLHDVNGNLIKHYNNVSTITTEALSNGIYMMLLDDGTQAKLIIIK